MGNRKFIYARDGSRKDRTSEREVNRNWLRCQKIGGNENQKHLPV